MTKIVQLSSPAGMISVETDDAEDPSGQMGFSPEGVVESVLSSFESAFQPIRAAAQMMAQELLSPVLSADGIEVEFGVKFKSKVGFCIAAADGEASIKVKLKWNKRRNARPSVEETATSPQASL